MIRQPLIIPDIMRNSPRPNCNEILRHLPAKPGRPVRLPPPLHLVFLCFTNRCGSAYLGDLLHSTGAFGPAGETLNAGDVLRVCRECGIGTFLEYFEHIVQRDAKGNFFIVKVAAEQIALLVQSGILDQIIGRSDFVFLNRADKLGQAISCTIAEQNNRWAWDSPSQFPDEQLVYSAKRLTEQIYYVMLVNQCFEQFFALNGIMPINVEYGRLAADPQGELDEIARRLRLPGLPIAFEKLRFRRQAGEVNRQWRSRYLREPDTPAECFFGILPGQQSASVTAHQRTDEQQTFVDVLAHIHNVGDVKGAGGMWIGQPRTGRWVEGFSIDPRRGLSQSDLEYQSMSHPDQPPEWTLGGEYCGTRGKSLPLRGFRVQLRNAAAEKFRCEYSGFFMDGSTVGPMTAGEICRSITWQPLEAFKIVISRL